MFRTKKDVDRHVQDIFRKLQDENERTLRCYKIAELYFHVHDYESARRYLARYVEVRKEAKAHKLMGHILESLGQKEAALIQYKCAFELDGRQEDLILKVCELLSDPDVPIDVNRAKYWSDRGDKLFPRNKTVFQLKEKILSIERPTNNEEDLEKLITSELAVRPTDVHLRVKLLKHYMEKNKLDEAYKHATDVEATNIHRNSLLWYQVLCELLSQCKNSRQLNWVFWILYISSLERYAALSIKEQGNTAKKTSEAIQAVYNFDQHLFEAKAQSFSSQPSLTENIFVHMWGQLHFHLACLLLQNTQREQSSWSEAGRLCAPLLLTAMHTKPIDVTASWASYIDSSLKNHLHLWYREGSYRCSQAGHVLLDYSRGNQKKLISNIEKFCSGSWRERIYQRIFVGKIYQKVRSSYFTNNNAMNPPFRLISQNELKRFDEVAEEVWPYSLHHQVWPAIKSRSSGSVHSNKHEGPLTNLSSHLFLELQFSVYNLHQASPVTLSRLDIDAFLNAAAFCASVVAGEHQQNNLLNPDRLLVLPADLTNPLCSEDQEKWWSAAYKMYRKEVTEDIGETRLNLQRGLEVVRCIGNHGLHPCILVHLARIFSYRAKQLKEKNPESCDVPALEARSELYWSAVVPLLERLQNSQTIRTSHIKLFDYVGKDMNNMELSHAIEEGKLLLAQKLLRDKLYEQAIEALQPLKCPEASFEQGKIYKKLADETLNSLPKESVTSEMKSQHVIILSKARNCFYLTLDRLRSPDADPKHPLNAKLCHHITTVEKELERIDPNTLNTDRNRNDCDDLSEESYSSAHSDEHVIVNNSMPVLNSSIQTPMRSIRRTPRQSSTPHQNQDMIDVSRNRNEARPSPERLDAQIRQLVHSIESLREQNRDQHRAMISKLDELIRISARKETQSQKPRPQPQVVNRNLEEELYGLYGEEDYADYNYSNTSLPNANANRTQTIAQNLFAGRHPYSPLVYPSPAATAAALQGYYQGGPLSFPDPAAAGQHMSGLYPAAAVAAAAAAGVYPMSSLYRGGLDQPMTSMQQMTENVLQHGLFAPRLPTDYSQASLTQQSLATTPQQPLTTPQQPLTTPQQQSLITPQQQQPLITPQQQQPLITPQQQQQQITPLQTSEQSKPKELARGFRPPSKDPPVNVVIPTSDSLPTTIPALQPNFNVTIPVQHRLGATPTVSTAATTPVSSSQLQQQQLHDPNAPHSYQISMPSQPTIPTTVNLPPLSATLTITSPQIKANIIENQNTSILSTGSRHSSDVTEIEHDPIPDFAPIIPLPDEVPVTTGEEDEEELFCARAKLFRFVNKEWKERGIGIVKLLKNKENKVRLLMRREQVLKICANHMLRKDMELTQMPKNEKAYMWVANDFADEELRLEKLCIKFKIIEEAVNFKENFEKARDSMPDETVQLTEIKSSSSRDKPAEKPVTKPESALNKSESIQNKPVEKIGGFSFTSSPIIVKPGATAETPEQKKPEETAKPSPFASFSFVKASDSTANKPATPMTGFSFTSPSVTAATPSSGQVSCLRRPHAPAPANVAKEGERYRVENGETVITEQNSSLMHFSGDTKHWKEKGIGIMKILLEKTSGRVRLSMNKDDDPKIIYTQVVSETVTFNLKAASVNWTIATDKNKSDVYMARFRDYDQASIFHKAVTSLQKSLKPSAKPTNSIANTQKPLSEMFKPAAGSWECKDCYTRNNATVIKCVSCQAPSPNAPAPRPTVQSVSKNLFEQFKPPTGSWECKDCYTRNSADTSSCVACKCPAPITNKPTTASTHVATTGLDLSKMGASGWECKQCHVLNSLSNQYCAACDAPKDPSMPPKPKSSGGFIINSSAPDTKSTFTFGMPQTTQPPVTKETPNFTFSFSKTSEKAVSSPISIFNSNKSATPASGSGFMFGTQPPSTPPSSGSGPFAFGSPGKSFDFQFQAKSPPVKSPERPETSDDEVVEESEDVYFAPVIPLPDKIEVKTGEEDEEVLYSHRAKLFKFDPATKEWKERGLGDIKLLKHAQTKKLRLVMRRDQVLKLCLNHAVTEALEISSKDDKTWMWSAGDYSEGEIEYIQFACRFKTPEIAQEFKKAMDDVCKSADSTSNSLVTKSIEVKTKPTFSTSKVSSSTTIINKESSPEIEVVYEVKVTPEEKAAALKLQLPENFYAYKYKEDCPGCIGCRDSDESLFKDDESKQQQSVTTKSTPSMFATIPASSTVQSTQPTSGLKMTFGTSAVFGGGDGNPIAKTTGFVFGNQSIAKPDSQETGLENLKVCGPTTIVQPSSTSSITTTTANIFGGTTTSAPTNIFGASSTTPKSIFGNANSSAPGFRTAIFSPFGTNTTAASSTESVFSKPLFGESKPIFGDSKNTATSTVSTTNIFDTTKTSPTTVATTNIFSNTKPPSTSIFGGAPATTTSSIFGDPKDVTSSIFSGSSSFGAATTASTTTSSIFGGTSSFGAMTTASTPKTIIFGGKAILGGTTETTAAGSVFGATATSPIASSIFGGAPSFGASSTTATSSNSTSVFGGSTSSTNSFFGGPSSVTSTFSSLAVQSIAQEFGTATTPVSNVKSTSAPVITTTSNTTSPFGSDASNQFGSKIGSGNNTSPSTGNIFTNSTPTTTIFDGSKSTETNPKPTKSKEGGVSFLPTENSLSFSTLAAQSKPTEEPAFKTDPNFQFEGAGASVFGVKTSQKPTKKKTPSKNSPNVKKEKEKEKDDDDDEEGDEGNEDEYDPHFEPIIPLPDAIEVRTGEEDEEKLFCQRAKLYRYDQNTKEWKERGTGEMKILYHAQHGTYRLLLRREQVHKVVCNLLLSPDLEFRQLNTSDRAWLWGGMNYAEPENPTVEQLAVKFKSPELADEFKKTVDKAQHLLTIKQNQAPKVSNSDQDHEDEDYEDDYAEGDDYEDDEEDEEEDEDEDEEYPEGYYEERDVLYDKRVTLFAQSDSEWDNPTMGNLRVLHDSDAYYYGPSLVFENDDHEIVSNTVIDSDMVMQCTEKECTWTAIDYAQKPSIKRSLRAVFPSVQTSQELHKIFKEALKQS